MHKNFLMPTRRIITMRTLSQRSDPMFTKSFPKRVLIYFLPQPLLEWVLIYPILNRLFTFKFPILLKSITNKLVEDGERKHYLKNANASHYGAKSISIGEGKKLSIKVFNGRASRCIPSSNRWCKNHHNWSGCKQRSGSLNELYLQFTIAEIQTRKTKK